MKNTEKRFYMLKVILITMHTVWIMKPLKMQRKSKSIERAIGFLQII